MYDVRQAVGGRGPQAAAEESRLVKVRVGGWLEGHLIRVGLGLGGCLVKVRAGVKKMPGR